MSGVGEAGLVLGLISATLTIFEAAQAIYEAASDTSGLPKKLRVVAEQIPLVYNALGLAEQNLQAKNVTQEAVHSAKPVLEQCKNSATTVKDIFDQTIPAKDASRAERLRKAVGLKMKSNKAKEHMEQVFKSMDLLAQKQVFQNAETLEDIKVAMEQLTNISDEEERSPGFVHSGAGAINANTGKGTQKNYNNCGPGNIYNAENQYFGRDQEDPSMMLAIADGVAFDAIGRDHDSFCLPDTRTDLLQDIRSWLSGHSSQHIYWLSGWAGTGKSTIARTLARQCRETDWQLGNFFFSRGGGDAGHIQKFVSTLARQLSYRWPAFKSVLQKAIATDEGIVYRNQEAQWAALILKPLSEVLTGSSGQRVLLVIDAVDECGTNDDMSHLVKLLLDIRGVNQTALRIFMTSRPEVAIRGEFDQDLSQHLHLALHQISDYIVQNDLDIFLRFHLTKIRQSRRLGTEWPGDANIYRLVAMSGNLFIWAATVTRYVSNGGASAKKRLSSILDQGCRSGGPEMALDDIYLMVLDNAISSDLSDEEKQEVSHDFRHLLGIIAVLFAPLSLVGLAHLLNIETEEIEDRLADLHSVLDVPSGTDGAIRLHHPSFRDFLYDRRRCRNESLCVDQIAVHSTLAKRCISILSVLRKDICGLTSAGTMVKDVDSAVLAQHLPSEVQYSCRYWLGHVEHGHVNLMDDGPVHRFLRASCAYWLEAMSLIGRVTEAMTIMMKLETLIDEKKAPQLQILVLDTLRFLHTFSHVLHQAPLQLYSAGLHFSPSQSIFRRLFSVDASRDIKLIAQIPDQWNACIQILEGHSRKVNSVVFSPDGSRLASGSADKTVRVWDVKTGQCERTLEGHSDSFTSVVFSPDGSQLASGSWDKTVRVWDVETGRYKRTLEGHSNWISSVVFSPDGSRLASGSQDGTVRVWDIKTGQCECTLEGYSDSVTSVVFSPDGLRLAWGSWDKTVRVLDVKTGQCDTLEGHSGNVTSVVFSPDGLQLASGSWDETVRVWDMETGQYKRTLEGHSDSVTSVVFSPNGLRLASGSDDNTVRVWDIETGQCKRILEGHSSVVSSVVFSPDGSRLASGSSDKTVRVWDVETGRCEHTLEGHSSWISSVVFSPDGSQLASGSWDETVRVWDVETGQYKRTLEGHSDNITSVVFSPNGSRLASGSDDNTVRVWDIETGQCKRILEGHLSGVNSVVFSPDRLRLASGSWDKTVRVWDVETGQYKRTLEGHSNNVTSVVFSPDGSRLASGSADKTVRVWDLASSEEIFHCAASYRPVIEFSDDGSQLIVDVNLISLPSQTSFSTTVTRLSGLPTDANASKLGISHDWLTWSGQMILWLPPDYRSRDWASYGNTIVIGSGTGRVIFVYYVATNS